MRNHQHLSLPEGKLAQMLAVCIPASLVVIISLSVVGPLFRWYSAREKTINYKQQEVSHITDMYRLLPSMQRQTINLEATAGNPGIFLLGSTDAIAGADLEAAIDSIANRSNASLTTLTIMPSQPVTPFRQITIDTSLTANWEILIDFLSALDLARPRMIVSNLTITESGQANELDQDVPLQIDFSVSAFRLAPK